MPSSRGALWLKRDNVQDVDPTRLGLGFQIYGTVLNLILLPFSLFNLR
jgi:hypothetical protein